MSDSSQTRVQAVREQILSYAPDLIGLQEDGNLWVNNIGAFSDYTLYKPSVTHSSNTMEYCSIYVKNGIEVKESGYKWLTSDGTADTVALTVSELADGDGKYDMSSADREKLGITDDASLKSGYAGDDIIAKQGNMLSSRLMNYVVINVGGKDIIYVNTHFQHRGYNDKEYSEHPLYMLRYYERSAQFELVCEQIELLKEIYPEAEVMITADFNDTAKSDFYTDVCAEFTDAKSVAATVISDTPENTWNSAYKNEQQGQGYTSSSENQVVNRIDFCFVSQGLAQDVQTYQTGKCKFDTSSGVTVYPSDHLPVIVDIKICS